MSFINKKWLDFLGLEVPTTVDEFEQTLIAFRDHASELQAEFNIDGSIIPQEICQIPLSDSAYKYRYTLLTE